MAKSMLDNDSHAVWGSHELCCYRSYVLTHRNQTVHPLLNKMHANVFSVILVSN